MRIVQGDTYSAGAVIASAVIMAGVLGYILVVPRPTVGNALIGQQPKKRKIILDISSTHKQYADLKAAPLKHVYTTSTEEAAPDALQRLNALGKAAHVTVNGFRPQKEQDAGAVQILPYFLTVQGSFDGIAKFLESLSNNEPKLAISLIQIAAPETGNSQVTASINVVGYLQPADDSDTADTASGKTAVNATTSKSSDLGGHSGSGSVASKTVTGTPEKPSDSLKVSVQAKDNTVAQKLKPSANTATSKEKQSG
jgi:hypothetical protein